jgi:hypothetical protein
MKRRSIGILLSTFVVSSFFSAAAFAQGAPARRSDSCAEQRRLRPGQACKLDIEGSDLTGEHIGPNGDTLLAQRERVFGSLIRYRTSMLDKLAKDTDRF